MTSGWQRFLRRGRPARWTRPGVDPYALAAERRTAHLVAPEPADPVGRREQARRNDEAVARLLGPEGPPVATADHTVPVPGHADVRLRVYWPYDVPAPPGSGLPVLVYFYGGAFSLAGIDWCSRDGYYRRIAADAGLVLVAGDYAHAPEHRFPTQPEQCWRVLEWAADAASDLGADADRVAVGGASSGGNLAAAATLLNRQRNRRPIRLQVLEQPVLDLTAGHARTRGMSSVPGAIVRAMARRVVRQYLGDDPAAPRDPLASPLLAGDMSGLPPAMIWTSELDPLSGDGEAYARALTAAGVPACCVRTIGATHTSPGMRRRVPAADHQYRDLVGTLRAALHDDPVRYPDPRS